ncbi:uncharacterized protein V1513DRAFT_466306 [Lipomyces chichibuensis]|uniref:uncharacterized protein n=1 Tax=Lipomyces chichibuensis TaxID=1546026 RepID=UPI0033434E30
MDDFNSSDIEFEPAVSKNSGRQPGRASIALIIEAADIDRLTSKRALWVERFNAFRTQALKQSLSVPFTGDDVLRFFDSIIGKLRPVGRDKPAVIDDVVISGFSLISDYGTFTYPKSSGYELTKHDGIRLQTFIDVAVRDKRLTRGLWNRRVWLNFMIVSRMGRAWLEHHHNHGTWNWDITLARLMSVVLVTSLGCRAGDAARSQYYEGMEFLQYRHVELLLEGEPKFENLRAQIKIEFAKGSKNVRNKELEFYLRPLGDPRYRHMCTVSLLMIHALRHGLVVGSTIQEVLEHASNAADGRVVWTFPDRPVLCAFTNGVRKCDLDKPADTGQLRLSVKQMEIVSNILTRVYTRATRLGAAQDVSHLPQAEGLGFTTNEVRQSLGHHNKAFQRGITEGYAGSPMREFYNDRAKREFVHPWGAKFSEQSALELIKSPVTEEEIRDWQDRNEPLEGDRNSRSARRRAQYNVRRERQEEFIKTATPETTKRSRSSKTEATPLSQKSTSEVNVIASFVGSHQERQSSTTVSAIDPRLLDGDVLDDSCVDTNQFERLDSQLFGKATSHGPDQQQTDFDSVALFEEQRMESSSADKVQITASEFVSAYSNINVVSNHEFAKAWPSYLNGKTSFAEGIGQHSVRGNSRDDPTPLEFRCRKTRMCLYSHIRRDVLAKHEFFCSETLVARAVAKEEAGTKFSCDCSGRSEVFATKKALLSHIGQVHKFQQKACPHGCNHSKVYTTLSGYNMHLDRRHSGRWPTQCRYPDCNDDSKYNDATAYRRHLHVSHGLKTRVLRAPYLPKKPVAKCQD